MPQNGNGESNERRPAGACRQGHRAKSGAASTEVALNRVPALVPPRGWI